jgi:5-hydroxyisourate hydrolase-like protein (transthyretin family)
VKARVQVQEGTAWRTLATARTNTKGRVRATVTAASTPGAYAYRVRAAKTATTLAGVSEPVTLTVG